ncbi:serine/threonine-protein phosphatase 6 regulatory ankyrin repeat subunit C-like [Oscarella lobularis]|uniref:serine/threonine-protein phosphatase 6 regulatory ankyrin repeat subunit C-like n=1 Tax=Oscarella lobularis TaxID=121494 RepID=UPI00331332EA
MASLARSTIDRLTTIIEKQNYDELKSFLSTEKGFPSEQLGNEELSLLHYVAEREFERAEEADEWLSYAIVQKNQVIEGERRIFEFVPLHFACKLGTIFGVEWLVSHSANINVKDRNGRTPYSVACASSVDTMKKIVCLEEHGYILSPDDSLWGAENQFSSSEKADEIFHHLVNEKGVSVNAIEETNEMTPLHSACNEGSIFGVKWLMQHHAAINIVTKFGQTPFIFACGSLVNRSAKVCYLDEKSADCQAKVRLRFYFLATNSINTLPSFSFKIGRRLCFMPLAPQSVKMT